MAAALLAAAPACRTGHGPAGRPTARPAHPTHLRPDRLRCPARTTPAEGDRSLRLNHIQVKGTHNSYHRASRLRLRQWNYTHLPIYDQLDKQNVRQIELDVYLHGRSGRLRVYHLPLLDSKTTCRTLTKCLLPIRQWSDRNRTHLPIFVFIQPKGIATWADPRRLFRRINKAILSVFPSNRLIVPDQVRGTHRTLAEAVACRGWPRLDRIRGSVMFVLLVKGRRRKAYTRGRHLRGRLMFVTAGPSSPYGVILNVDDPQANREKIRRAVRSGLLVRTRADADVREPSRSDYRRYRAALASGAHIIATDFPVKGRRYRYFVTIPGGGPARCNPLTAPPGCDAKGLEPQPARPHLPHAPPRPHPRPAPSLPKAGPSRPHPRT